MPPPKWMPHGWQTYAWRVLQATLSSDKLETHRTHSLQIIGCTSDQLPSCELAYLKLCLLDVFSALAVPPPEDTNVRPGSESSRRYWLELVRDAETPSILGDVLLSYAKLVPKTAFRKGFRKWWLADGGLEDGKARMDKELHSG